MEGKIMANPWFRMYSEFATDAKVQSIPEVMQRRLVMLFCLRCSDVTVTLSDDELAFQLRISDEELEETKVLFLRKGFIDEDWEIVNWDKRQFASDSSAERTARYRERKKLIKKEAVTSQERHSDALDTDTDTDTEADKKKQTPPPSAVPEYSQEFEEAWRSYPVRPGASKKDSSKAWKARLKAGVDPEVILSGVRRYAAYVLANKTEGQYVKQPTTFFGTGEHYLADWTVVPQARGSPPYQTANDKAKAWADIATGKANGNHQPQFIDIN